MSNGGSSATRSSISLSSGPIIAPMRLDAILRVAELRAIETRAAGAPLMERAGLAAAEVARSMLAVHSARVLVLAGPGNNGGDAFVVARWLKSLVLRRDRCVLRRRRDAAGPTRPPHIGPGAKREARRVREWPDGRFGLIIDGLFGIGLTRAIEGVAAQWIARANASSLPFSRWTYRAASMRTPASRARRPFRASATATFIALKPGLLTGDGPDHCGTISVHGLELDARARADARGSMLAWATQRSHCRKSFGARGAMFTRAASARLPSSAAATAWSARRSLARSRRVASGRRQSMARPCASTPPAVDWVQPELDAPSRSERCSMLRRTRWSSARAWAPAMKRAHGSRRRCACQIPLLIDADALNLIARDAALASDVAARAAPTVLTPHPAEAARLSGTTVEAIQSDRLGAALSLSAAMNAAVVLKGAGSVVAYRDGRFAINSSGNAALASAGTGDVLAGMIGALLAQAVPVDTAVALGVCLHGAAADTLVAEGVGPLG